MNTYLLGQSGGCEWEPKWKELFPKIAKPDASSEEHAQAAEWLSTQEVTCGKLKLRPDACHGCPDNPAGEKRQQADQKTVADHMIDIRKAEHLGTALRMGINVGLADVTAEELAMLGVFYWEVEALIRVPRF